MIEELCKKIKEKRAELGHDIEYTVEKTKLHPAVIRDIEDGNFGKVNPIYIKGFIKIYANFLGIDIGNALDEIGPPKQQIKKDNIFKKVEGKAVFNRIVQAIKKVSAETKRKISIVVLVIVAIFAIFNIGKFIVNKVSQFFKQKPKVVKKENESQAPLAVVVADELSVSLTTQRKCFIRAKVDGEILFEGVLDAGVIENWKGQEEIELKISDGSAVYLEVNGRAIPPLTSMRKPIKSLKITPSGISVDK